MLPIAFKCTDGQPESNLAKSIRLLLVSDMCRSCDEDDDGERKKEGEEQELCHKSQVGSGEVAWGTIC